MMNFKLIYVISHWLGLIVVSVMSGEVCDKLSKMPWKKYDVTPVPKMAGIYAIGQKIGSKDTEYLYIGRSNNVKRRLQEHKTPTPQQDIDKKVAGNFKQHKQSELRIKYVSEQKQKSKEGAYIDCMTEKIKYRPVLNMRAGDCCTSCAGGKKRSCNGGSPALRSSKSAKVGSAGGHKVRSSGSPKARSSGGTSSVRSSGGPKMRPSGCPKVRSPGGIHSIRSSASHKVRSGARVSIRSFGGRRGR